MENIIKSRKSIRVFDPNYKISNEKVLEMIDLAQLAPSSNNLQPWHFVAVTTDEGKAKVDHLFVSNRSQFETSSHLIFVFGDENKFERGIDISKEALQKGVIPKEVSDIQIKKYQNASKLPKDNTFYSKIYFDLGLVVMNLMLIVKKNGYESCAIGGFDVNRTNSALGLSSNYLPCIVLAIGKGTDIDTGNNTYRLPASKTTTII